MSLQDPIGEEDADNSSSTSSDFDDGASSSSSDSSVISPRPGNLRRTSSTTYSDHEAEQQQAADANKDGDASGKKKKEKGDVWIYVADAGVFCSPGKRARRLTPTMADYKLYLGIKQRGRFQHSSFLAGGPITSAGTLVVRAGKLVQCKPMSGHYR